ncbi:MAG: hypothetical protein ABFD86_09585 [Bryobacteraceae bacterium]
MQTESPDGQIKILFGDPSIGPMTDPRGVIVGTNTDTRPNVDFQALLQLP